MWITLRKCRRNTIFFVAYCIIIPYVVQCELGIEGDIERHEVIMRIPSDQTICHVEGDLTEIQLKEYAGIRGG